MNEKLLNYRILLILFREKDDVFLQKVNARKSSIFLSIKKKNGSDFYENFEKKEVLEINNINYKILKGTFFF